MRPHDKEYADKIPLNTPVQAEESSEPSCSQNFRVDSHLIYQIEIIDLT